MLETGYVVDRLYTVLIRKLSKVFLRTPVLKSLDFDLKKGEFAVVFGSNGAEKTTFLKLISALVAPTFTYDEPKEDFS